MLSNKNFVVFDLNIFSFNTVTGVHCVQPGTVSTYYMYYVRALSVAQTCVE